MELVWLVLCLKDNLSLLAIGQIVQKNGYLGEKLAGRVGIFLILTKGTWPSLLCHKSTLSLVGVYESLSNVKLLLME